VDLEFLSAFLDSLSPSRGPIRGSGSFLLANFLWNQLRRNRWVGDRVTTRQFLSYFKKGNKMRREGLTL
jgi:hypothetical protein